MKICYLCATFFSFLPFLYATEPERSECLEREKALTFLETAENVLLKAKDVYPSCKRDLNSTDHSVCGGKKTLAYIDLSKKLISDVRENFPICPIDQHGSYRDCAEILASGHNESGVYVIWLGEPNTTRMPLVVYCDMDTEGGGWTLIQRRGKFQVQQDFFLDFESYKSGFGNITQEFWLGNENIRILCHNGCKIRFDIQSASGTKGFAVYNNFKLSGSDYTLYISDYAGDLGDGMRAHNNYDFSTKDKGNTVKVNERRGGWWYSGDTQCNLNGIYQPGKSDEKSVYWYRWSSFQNLGRVEIKVR